MKVPVGVRGCVEDPRDGKLFGSVEIGVCTGFCKLPISVLGMLCTGSCKLPVFVPMIGSVMGAAAGWWKVGG